MKIVHTADWHIGKVVNNFSLLADQKQLLHEWIATIKAIAPDVVLMAGDLYDRSLPNRESVAVVNELLTEMVTQWDCPICIISGNHDGAERIDYASHLLEKQQLYMVGTPTDEPIKVQVKEADIYFLPFADHLSLARLYPDAQIHNIEDAVRVQVDQIKAQWDPERLNIIMYHGYVMPSSALNNADDTLIYSDSERPTEIGTSAYVSSALFADFDYVALGHLHAAQRVGSERIRYSGSPMKYSKSEAHHRKQFLEIDLTAKEIEVTPHWAHLTHDLHILKGDFKTLMRQQSDDYLFIELTDTTVIHEGMNRLRRQYPNIMGLTYTTLAQTPQQETAQKMADLQAQSVEVSFADFFASLTGKTLTSTQQNIIDNTWQEIAGEEV